MMKRLLLLACAALAGGCAAHPPAALSTHDAPEHLVAQRGSIVSTVVIAATVQAGVEVVVTAPVAGRYPGRPALPTGMRVVRDLVAPGEQVPRHYPVAVATALGFALVAELDEATIYKLYEVPLQATGQIKQGPGPFACPLADRVPQPRDGALTLTCLVPTDLRVFAGMSALMAVTTAVAHNVVVLPIEAVAGSAQRGQVWLVDPAGKRQLRDVELGITDGVQIEIKSGLREGESVALPGPDLSAWSR